MPRGFFHGSSILKEKDVDSLVPKCGACGLNKGCGSPKMPVTGEGRRKVLVVAEAPGKEEDLHGTQLIGPAGQELRKYLRKVGVDLDRDCWKTNALICRPPKNRTPTDSEIEYCRPNLIGTVKELKPEVVVLLGGAAVNSLIGSMWKRDVGAVSRWVGWTIPDQTYNCWICPTYHSSYIAREENEVLSLWFSRHLEAAFSLEDRPWNETPDYTKQVELIFDEEKAAEVIHYMRDFCGIAAFDYETTALKPDVENAQIVCCSIAWGFEDVTRCISFPVGEISSKALSEFIKSPIPKIASNMKFEDRWTRKLFGHGVRNWRWDTMQAAHVLDNRPGITSLKFQAFVLLGFPSYDEYVTPFLDGSSVTVNRVLSEIRIDQLLLYCGLDSLLEVKVALKQADSLGVALC
jgi:DNA polymerase